MIPNEEIRVSLKEVFHNAAKRIADGASFYCCTAIAQSMIGVEAIQPGHLYSNPAVMRFLELMRDEGKVSSEALYPDQMSSELTRSILASVYEIQGSTPTSKAQSLAIASRLRAELLNKTAELPRIANETVLLYKVGEE